MQTTMKKSLICLMLLAVAAGSAVALVHDRSDSSPLAAKEFQLPELEAPPHLSRANDLPQEWRASIVLRRYVPCSPRKREGDDALRSLWGLLRTIDGCAGAEHCGESVGRPAIPPID